MFQDFEVMERQRDTPYPDMKDFLVNLPAIGKVAQANLSRSDIGEEDSRGLSISRDHGGSATEGVRYDFTRLFVPPESRGRGIGSTLMRSIIAWTDKNQISLHNSVGPGYVAPEEIPRVITFFERFGFVHHGDGEMSRVPSDQ